MHCILYIVKKTIDFNKFTYSKVETMPRTKPLPLLSTSLNNSDPTLEIGIDEVGRGPLFGRVYTAAVILPKDDTFDHFKMKDSKKFHSTTKIKEAAEYIKANAIAWSVSFEDEKTIDEINILQATQQSMHTCIREILKQEPIQNANNKVKLLVDGNYFKPYTGYNGGTGKIEPIPYECIEQGDNKYSCIAAASILAKVARDAYIADLCIKNPELVEKYSLLSNKGYGSKKHIDGIKEHGITIWHRRTFGICKEYV